MFIKVGDIYYSKMSKTFLVICLEEDDENHYFSYRFSNGDINTASTSSYNFWVKEKKWIKVA